MQFWLFIENENVKRKLKKKAIESSKKSLSRTLRNREKPVWVRGKNFNQANRRKRNLRNRQHHPHRPSYLPKLRLKLDTKFPHHCKVNEQSLAHVFEHKRIEFYFNKKVSFWEQTNFRIIQMEIFNVAGKEKLCRLNYFKLKSLFIHKGFIF